MSSKYYIWDQNNQGSSVTQKIQYPSYTYSTCKLVIVPSDDGMAPWIIFPLKLLWMGKLNKHKNMNKQRFFNLLKVGLSRYLALRVKGRVNNWLGYVIV